MNLKGLYTIAQLRPIDSLRQLISESGGQITPSLKLFIQKYPLDEVCAMCISIALNAEKTRFIYFFYLILFIEKFY